MLINNISQAIHNELRKIDGSRKTEKEKELPNKAKASSAKTGGSDSSELSLCGKKQSEAGGDMHSISSMVKAQPDLRTDKIAEAKLKISSGFYNSEAFADKLADKLMHSA